MLAVEVSPEHGFHTIDPIAKISLCPARPLRLRIRYRMVTNSEYRAKSGSAVKSLAGSDIACAIRRWSNGSRWCSGNCSTKAAAIAKTGSSAKPLSFAALAIWSGANAKFIRPIRFLTAISQMLAALNRISFCGSSRARRPFSESLSGSASAQSKMWAFLKSSTRLRSDPVAIPR